MGSKFYEQAGGPMWMLQRQRPNLENSGSPKPQNTLGKARWSSRPEPGFRPFRAPRMERGSHRAQLAGGCAHLLLLGGPLSELPARRGPWWCGFAGGSLGLAEGLPGSSTAPVHSKTHAVPDAVRRTRDDGYSSSDRPRSAYQASISDMTSSALSAYSNSFRCGSLIMCSLQR